MFFFLGKKNEANLDQRARSPFLTKDEEGILIEKGMIFKQRYVLKNYNDKQRKYWLMAPSLITFKKNVCCEKRGSPSDVTCLLS